MQNQNSFLVIVVILAAAFVIYSSKMNINTNVTDTGSSITARDFDRLVSYHLQNERAEQELLAAKAELMKQEIPTDIMKLDEKPTAKNPIDVEMESTLEAAQKHLQATNASIQYQMAHSPDALIGQKLQIAQAHLSEDDSYREAYVREFLNRARKDGFAITLNEDLIVTNIKRVHPSRGPQSIGGFQPSSLLPSTFASIGYFLLPF